MSEKNVYSSRRHRIGRSSPFARALAERQPDPAARRWIFVPYDQLTDQIGPLSREAPEEIGIVLVESPWKAARRPYHRQKLALVLANQRHFALEQAARGVAVRYLVAHGPYQDTLAPFAREHGPLRVMEPAERELRTDLAPLVASGALEFLPHEGWLTTREQFVRSQGDGPPWRMDAFYRFIRRDTGILMRGTKPEGGKFSFDADNRKAWPGHPPAPQPPTFTPDAVTREVLDLVAERFVSHPGVLNAASLPATRSDAQTLLDWAFLDCLPFFGPFEDAMSARSTGLFHTRLSALIHLHRILPRQVIDRALATELSLTSKEGFIRQVLGWREFVRHVHVASDGFRTAAPTFLGADGPLPRAFWGAPSGLACLDRVVRDVWAEGYSHHITRLMVLSNLATLLDVSPRELTDWFWVAYTDAYDWVVEPNVLGMGTFAAGDLMTTKPYVSGAAYIDRMSDYCADCAFDPKTDCPITPLYWAFLARHRNRLADNPRLRLALGGLRRRPEGRRRADALAFESIRDRLGRGEPLA